MNRTSLFSLCSPDSKLEIHELGADHDVPLCHIYPEAQVQTPDGRFVVLQSYGDTHPDFSYPLDARAGLWLADLENEGALLPLCNKAGAIAPAVSPDGQFCYYFVQEEAGTPAILQRYSFTDGRTETLTALNRFPEGSGGPCLGHIGPLSTIRADGLSLAVAFNLTEADADYPDWGLLVIDLATLDSRIILRGPSWRNIHPQYCRAAGSRDILVQENHGVIFRNGQMVQLVGDPGADIHVIRDTGGNFRSLPWGRAEGESCRGHQCWRGGSQLALGAMTVLDPEEGELIRLIESPAVQHCDHIGIRTPGGVRNDLSRNLSKPLFDHFATDRSGAVLVSDGKRRGRWFLQLAELGEPLQNELKKVTDILDVGMTSESPRSARYHPHPFLSHDGNTAFFNSNITGCLKAYMIKNIPSPNTYAPDPEDGPDNETSQ